MDCTKVGSLIYSLRKEKGMTQQELADAMSLSDRTVSKWERGLGCPDVSLLNELSAILGVSIEKILSGEINMNNINSGNLKRVRFYVCQSCGNFLCGNGDEVFCCGRKIAPAEIKREDEHHFMTVEEVEDDFYVTLNHEMSKSHYISFVAYVDCDRVLLMKLYPEQNAELRFPKMRGGKLYAYCNNHGLWEKGK